MSITNCAWGRSEGGGGNKYIKEGAALKTSILILMSKWFQHRHSNHKSSFQNASNQKN